MEEKGRQLARLLNSRIDDLETSELSRADIISRMGAAAGIDSGTVNAILNGSINCPPERRLRGFARVLGISLDRLQRAARADGCEDEASLDEAVDPAKRVINIFRSATEDAKRKPCGCGGEK